MLQSLICILANTPRLWHHLALPHFPQGTADSPFCGYVLLKLARPHSTSERVLKILKTVRTWTLSCFVTSELFLFCILLKNVF